MQARRIFVELFCKQEPPCREDTTWQAAPRSAFSLAGLLLCSLCSAPFAHSETITYHSDDNLRPKLILAPDNGDQFSGASSQDIAEAYLIANASQLGLTLSGSGISPFSLYATKESLSATHFHYSQNISGVVIENAELVISVDKTTQHIVRVYNQTDDSSSIDFAQAQSQTTQKRADIDSVLSTIWAYQPHASTLLAEPKHQLAFVKHKGTLTLAYIIHLTSSALTGAWEYIVDAHTGGVIDVRRLDTPIRQDKKILDGKAILAHIHAINHTKSSKKTGNKSTQKNISQKALFKTTDTTFEKALSEYFSREKKRKNLEKKPQAKNDSSSNILLAHNGPTARVFDPDPRTTLNTEDLSNSSDLSLFEPAYFIRELLGIGIVDGVYTLAGPWVEIIDWDPPESAPSTSASGHWESPRGELAFYDTMVYYHIDKNQRYLQSLGYVNNAAIQGQPIEIDTNGVNGEDNAFYTPLENRISFGSAHGCVSNAEDADVILHEYGHAIQHDIVPNWGGGDSGAIGEGFSDYWAGSYSYSTPNGKVFHPEWLGSWNAHGECWEGRTLDRTDLQYDRDQMYFAHQYLSSGGYSDELWSAPLFKSLVELDALNIAREEIDSIIVESHYGLGGGITMTEMAYATVDAAERLYPDGPHANVLRKNFKAQNIIPRPLEIGEPLFSNIGDDEQLDAGELAAIQIPIQNLSAENMSGVSVTLSTEHPGVSFLVDRFENIDIPAGEAIMPTFRLEVDENAVCGQTISYQITLDYFEGVNNEDPAQFVQEYSVTLGEQQWVTRTQNENADIPSHESDPVGIGLRTTLNYDAHNGLITTDNFRVYLDIDHSFAPDLRLQLISPSNTQIILSPNLLGDHDGFTGYIPGDINPGIGIADLAGEPVNGDWRLTIIDQEDADNGTLVTWGISYSNTGTCNPPADRRQLTSGLLNFVTSGEDAFINPGDTVNVTIPLVNNDSRAVTNITATLSTPDEMNIVVADSAVQYTVLEAFGTASSETFTLTLPEHRLCDDVNLQVSTEFTAGDSEVLSGDISVTLPVGEYTQVSKSEAPFLSIPDFEPNGDIPGSISTTIEIDSQTPIDSDSFSLDISVPHSYTSDLTIYLESPSGTRMIVYSGHLDLSGFLEGNFPGDFEPFDPFSVFEGENPAGTWTLTIEDHFAEDVGTLESWTLNMTGEKTCRYVNEAPTVAVNETSITVQEGDAFTLSAADSTDADGDELNFAWSLTRGNSWNIPNATSSIVDFSTTPNVTRDTTYEFTVTVTDALGTSSNQSVSVTVLADATTNTNNTTNNSNAPSKSGGTVSITLLLMLLGVLPICCYSRRGSPHRDFRSVH